MFKRLICFLVILVFLISIQEVHAQDEPNGPTYIIQQGDTLFGIALRFGVSVEEIISVNNLINPDALSIGDQIIIPGFEGIQGVLEIRTTRLGENLSSITLSERVSPSAISRLNNLSSPTEVYAGRSLIVPSSEEIFQPVAINNINALPFLEKAVLLQANPWELLFLNMKTSSWLVAGDINIYRAVTSGEEDSNGSNAFFIDISPLPLSQGKTITVAVDRSNFGAYQSKLGDQELTFFPSGEQWIARVGIPAMQPAGLVNFLFSETNSDGIQSSYSQPILIEQGQFANETVSGVQSLTIDPQIIKEEDAILDSITSTITEKLWIDTFKFPVDEPCIGSGFGNRRSYNSGAYLFYHTGLDFTICSASNLNIYSPAPGIVAFTGTLPIKGNFTVIDHGQGIMSGYAHQDKIMVNVGDRVETGQQIGIIGNTGRSVGPHLHWEVWVNGVEVDPYDWTQVAFN